MVPLSSLRYFNPRSPRGERPARQVVMCVPVLISIHAPLAGSDLYFFGATFHRRNFNPRSPRGERRAVVGHSPKGEISIHAPLAGSDDLMPGYAWTGDISIHAPLAGSDLLCFPMIPAILAFQSTLPSRGATSAWLECVRIPLNFNPRSPRGERLPSLIRGFGIPKFQSTLPSRGATQNRRNPPEQRRYFNPRSPRGERPA